MRADVTRVQVEALVLHLRTMLGDDDIHDQLLLDSLEGQTDLFEMAGRLLDWIENDEGTKAALVSQIQDRNDRKSRAEKRIDAYRETLRGLMEAAGIDKLPLPEATVTLRKVAPKPVVTDPEALPDALCKITRKPDMAAIKAAVIDQPLPGVALDNGGVSLTIRRK
jgi:hypothetical protein